MLILPFNMNLPETYFQVVPDFSAYLGPTPQLFNARIAFIKLCDFRFRHFGSLFCFQFRMLFCKLIENFFLQGAGLHFMQLLEDFLDADMLKIIQINRFPIHFGGYRIIRVDRIFDSVRKYLSSPNDKQHKGSCQHSLNY